MAPGARELVGLGVVYTLGFIHGSFWSAARPERPAWEASLDARFARPCASGAGDAWRRPVPAVRGTLPAGLHNADDGDRDQAIGRAAEQPWGVRSQSGVNRSVGSPDRVVSMPAGAARAEKRVIAYSLYGAQPKYCKGALLNAELVGSVFPGWIARFYVDARTVPAGVLAGLRERGAELVEVDTSRMRDQHMFWRFWAAADRTVDRFICRDVDSRLLPRDFAAVSEWVDSGLPFHFERDHPSHSNYPISGGLWGGTRHAAPDMLELIAAFPTDANYLSDMNFLNEVIWPRARARSLQHDSFSCDRFGARPFPMARSAEGEHVGQVFDADGRPREADVRLLLEAASPVQCRHPDDAPTPGNRQRDARPTAKRRAGGTVARSTARRCQEIQRRHQVVPGSSWGDAPPLTQAEWTSLACDAALASSAPLRRTSSAALIQR